MSIEATKRAAQQILYALENNNREDGNVVKEWFYFQCCFCEWMRHCVCEVLHWFESRETQYWTKQKKGTKSGRKNLSINVARWTDSNCFIRQTIRFWSMVFDAILFGYVMSIKWCLFFSILMQQQQQHQQHQEQKNRSDNFQEPIIIYRRICERMEHMKRWKFIYRLRYNPTQQISVFISFLLLIFFLFLFLFVQVPFPYHAIRFPCRTFDTWFFPFFFLCPGLALLFTLCLGHCIHRR